MAMPLPVRWASLAVWLACWGAASAQALHAPAAPAAPAAVPGNADMVTACMLLGSVAFVMSLFYLLNYPDEDIRHYSWGIVSQSICTFVGVLIGTTWGGFLTSVVLGPEPGFLQAALVQGQMAFIWYLLLTLTLAYVSGAIGSSPPKTPSAMILNMKCFAVLLGIVTGASNMGIWGLVQQNVPRTIKHTTLVIPVAALVLWSFFRMAQFWRDRVSLSDDGTKDHFEEIWDKYTKETEDGATCMCLAHLVVQVCRFAICGQLPLAGGQLNPGYKPSVFDTEALAIMALLFACQMAVFDMALPEALGRFKQWLKKISGNCMAFCMLYSVQWTIIDDLNLAGPRGAMALALAVTMVGFGLIFVLDFIADLNCTGSDTDREVKSMVVPLSLLIGMSWKQAFVAAFQTIVRKEHVLPTPEENLCLTVVLVIVVVPAWRWYILPVVMNAELVKESRRKVAPEDADQKKALDAPLLEAGQGEPAWRTGLVVKSAELQAKNVQLEARNQELEASIASIHGELGELKKLAAILS